MSDGLENDNPSHDDVHFFNTTGARRLSGWRYVPDLSLWICLAEGGWRQKPYLMAYDGEHFIQFKYYGRMRA